VPERIVTVDLTTGEEVQIAARGERITGLACVLAPRGVLYSVRMGNNPTYKPVYSGRGTWVFGSNVPANDTTQGVFIKPAAPAPNLVLEFKLNVWSGSA